MLYDKREIIINELKENGIPVAIYYSKPLHLQTAFSHLGYKTGSLPVAEEVAKKIFSLPMHPYLSKKEQISITGLIKKEFQ